MKDSEAVPTTITSVQVRYLKHVCAQYNIKVSLRIIKNNVPVLHILDCEFDTYSKALAYTQFLISQVVDSQELEVVS